MSAMDSNVVSTASLTRHDDDDDGTSAIIIAKVTAMVVLGMVSIFMGLLPLQLSKWFGWSASVISPRSAKVIEMLLGFGGGVLLSTTFLHILPEVSEGVEALVESGSLPSLDVSLAETFMLAGFFLMYLIEELVHVYLRRDERRRKAISENPQSVKDVNKSTNELVENGLQSQPQTETSHGYGHGHSHIPLPASGDDNVLVSSLRGLLVVLGLSVHELFEGLAVGLSSTASDVWYLLGAVAAHKFVIAFCIGIELISCRTRISLMVIYICTYSLVTPIGIGIAMILTSGANALASGTAITVLQGLAAGTLLYVVFFEILRKQRHGLLQYAAVLAGFLLMFTIQLTMGHGHTHSH